MHYDVIVVGGGHAGIESALASSRLGLKTLMITQHIESIGQMSCNPALGGLAKSHLIREIDALGGEMAHAGDDTAVQIRILNSTKGSAVQAPRQQNDRGLYRKRMQDIILSNRNLNIKEDEASNILVDDMSVTGIGTTSGSIYKSKVVILATGTFLRGLLHRGEHISSGGRMGEPSADILSSSLEELGLYLGRLKTGTPPRIDAGSINFSKLERQDGDEDAPFFSHYRRGNLRNQLPCYIARTNADTSEIISNNLHKAPIFTGQIKARGPRYCPSIEDKVYRFKERDSHHLFIEPEGINTREMYLNGFATSLPTDVQLDALHTIAGLEKVEVIRYGYAVEYDYIDPIQLNSSLMIKSIPGLFTAGQINGTSGYEEAAAQGLIAGINACNYIKDKEPLILTRDKAYIGVLIDDLVTKGTIEPYRMFTSRAEYRLLLRFDNADNRLMKIGRGIGLLKEGVYEEYLRRSEEFEHAREYLSSYKPSLEDLSKYWNVEEPLPTHPKSLLELLKRPCVHLRDLLPLIDNLSLDFEDINKIEAEVKYEGYINKQRLEIERVKRLEDSPLPQSLDYSSLTGLSLEAREKLNRIKPQTIGQASRISGVNPSDIGILLIALEIKKVSMKGSNETNPY
jgi:tRNA uridine 5-carboxymethylaminomethyl modification enzyme